jgi:hypothetical protein
LANRSLKRGDYEVGYGKPPVKTQFQKGKSGNPGGLPKGVPKVSVAYQKLLRMTAEELHEFKPRTAADAIAYRQVMTAIYGEKALAAAKEITDRTEGKARQTVDLDQPSEMERLIIRVRERVMAQTGIELSREEAIKRIVSYRPELSGSFE